MKEPPRDPEKPQVESSDLPKIFDDLYRSHFTGRVILHFRSGVPSVVDIPGTRPKRWILPT